jgi:hypothetical protein
MYFYFVGLGIEPPNKDESDIVVLHILYFGLGKSTIKNSEMVTLFNMFARCVDADEENTNICKYIRSILGMKATTFWDTFYKAKTENPDIYFQDSSEEKNRLYNDKIKPYDVCVEISDEQDDTATHLYAKKQLLLLGE